MQNQVTRGHAARTAIAAAFLLGLPAVASAAQVQSSLTPAQTGISVKQLMSTTLTTNIALPTAGTKPAGMGNVVAGVHFGTNTDVFAVGTKTGLGVNASEFWVRYTLDATSQEYHQFQSDPWGSPSATTTPIGGSLWLSFNLTTQSLQMYSDKLASGHVFDYGTNSTFAPMAGTGTVQTLFAGGTGEPDYQNLPGTNASQTQLACIECQFQWTLNLSFLQLRWNGSSYDLFTSAQGFDQVYSYTSQFSPYNEIDRYQANIAPVPVPAAAWLFGSGLLGLAASRRGRR